MTDPRCSAETVVAIARSWIGTPYRHQASCRGVGADCLGLVRGVWREIYGAEPEALPAYTPDWSEASGDEPLIGGARRHLMEVVPGDMRPGDVILFRMQRRAVAKHLGILAAMQDAFTIIHAYSGHSVCEQPLSLPWRERIAGVFRFPGSN
ncbi:MAG TPA: NlpC/P60 family protein [Paracoccaceae bacterium]|nr:NlpC/P60 family protein [Paracoccaceae bacterium]